MFEITYEEYEKYFCDIDGFGWVEVPGCGIVCVYRDETGDLLAIDNAGENFYCTSKYWEV